MNRSLQFVNLIGIGALALLCIAQWRHERLLNLRVDKLEKIRTQQSAKIDEDDRQIKADRADLDDFRNRVTLAESEISGLESKLSAVTAERDQLKGAVVKWSDAVAQRDAVIKQTGEEIQTLVSQRNDAVQQFNDLAMKFNAMVKEKSKQQ